MQLDPKHNNPPTDAEMLKEKLLEQNSKQITHAQSLIANAANLPALINDDKEAAQRADYIKAINTSEKSLEAIRVDEKEPYLTLGRVVDGFFKIYMDDLKKTKTEINKPLTDYLLRKEAEAKRKLREEAEAQRKKAEEEALIAAALEKAKQSEKAADMLTQASISDNNAAKLDKQAEAKPAELSRTRSASGVVASLRTWWTGEIKSIAALDLELLRYHISPDALQKAVTSYVSAGGRKLTGATIYEKSESVTR